MIGLSLFYFTIKRTVNKEKLTLQNSTTTYKFISVETFLAKRKKRRLRYILMIKGNVASGGTSMAFSDAVPFSHPFVITSS